MPNLGHSIAGHASPTNEGINLRQEVGDLRQLQSMVRANNTGQLA